MKKKPLDYCFQGQGDSKGSKYQWLFVRMISSEPQNILLPNLAWWCSIINQSVMWRKIVRYLQGQGVVEVMALKQGLIWPKYDFFYYNLWTAYSLANSLGLIIHHHKPECLLKNNNNKVTAKVQNINECLSRMTRYYLLNRWTFCYQTWYCDASLWAVVSCRKIGLLFSRSRS